MESLSLNIEIMLHYIGLLNSLTRAY